MSYISDYMRQYDYIQHGETKGVDIDFTVLWPGEVYAYINVNMLVEFTVEGLAVPTRLDLRPMKLPPFSSMSKDEGLLVLEVFRFMLFLQVVYSVLANFW